MSKYHLSEAYSHLYNPRKIDESFYDNLRFVDYLQQEEIEEVMESLLWEFMDYGSTLSESYNLIEGCFSDQILEEVLFEATVTMGAGTEKAIEDEKKAKKRAETYARRVGKLKSRRQEERKAKVTGALKKAKQTVSNAAAGTMALARSAATDTTGRAKGLVGQAKAALQNIVRKGARKAGSLAQRAGERIERSGEKAVASGLTSRQAGRATRGGQMALQFEPTTREKTGGMRKAIGSAIKGLGKKLFRAGAKSTTAPQGPQAPAAQGPRRPYNKREIALRNQAIAAAGKGPGETRLGAPAGTFTTTTKTGTTKPTSKTAKTQAFKMMQRLNPDVKPSQLGEEDLTLLTQYILEDLINEGYADTFEDAVTILTNLSEDVVGEIALEYIQD